MEHLLALIVAVAVATPPSVSVGHAPFRPGDPLLFSVSGCEDEPDGELGEWNLTFAKKEPHFLALVAIPVDTAAGQLEWVIRCSAHGEPFEMKGEVVIEAPNFPSKELKVASKYLRPSAKDRIRIREDQKAFTHAFSQKFLPPMFDTAFAWPREAETTAPFGDLRLFNGKKQSQHMGLDLDGDIGDPVAAANDGTVVLVRDSYTSGNTLLIYHGLNLFTAYFHLSKFEVTQGQKVKRGDLIGKVGKTGRVTGPHLHWAVKIGGHYVNPAALLELHWGFEKPEDPKSSPMDASTLNQQ